MSKKTSFEAALQQLDAAVTKLESGELTLDQSLSCFEKGVEAVRRCREQLRGAELRFEELSAELSSRPNAEDQ